MKKLLYYTLIFGVFGCQESNEDIGSTNVLENLTYTVDTVIIDPKGEILNLGDGARRSTISPDRNTFYHYEFRNAVITEVDLDKLELTAIHQFAKEGPNSVGFNPAKIYALPKDQFLVVSPMISVGIFNKNGEKLRGLNFNYREIEGVDLEEEGLINRNAVLSEDFNYLFALSSNNPTSTKVKLTVVDIETKKGKSIRLPAFDETVLFRVTMRSGNTIAGISENLDTQIIKEKLYIFSSATSDIYQYDYKLDSLRLIEFPHVLVSPRKSGDFKNEVSSEQEFEEEKAKLLYQTSFKGLILDDKSERFFRFAHKPIPDADRRSFERAEVFLFTYDQELNLIGEKHLTELDKIPEFAFFKDGKLWSYVNVDDELGFAVMDLKY